MNAQPKKPGVERLLTALTGKDRVEIIHNKRCVTCDRVMVLPFRDAISVREYTISGMCQVCQDEMFSGEE